MWDLRGMLRRGVQACMQYKLAGAVGEWVCARVQQVVLVLRAWVQGQGDAEQEQPQRPQPQRSPAGTSVTCWT